MKKRISHIVAVALIFVAIICVIKFEKSPYETEVHAYTITYTAIPMPIKFVFVKTIKRPTKPLEIPQLEINQTELEMLAKTVWGEARCCSEKERALVCWTIFQRVNDARFDDTIIAIITAENQFVGYDISNPIKQEILELCRVEYQKWQAGEQPPTLAPYCIDTEYYFFTGRKSDIDGKFHNFFRKEF